MINSCESKRKINVNYKQKRLNKKVLICVRETLLVKILRATLNDNVYFNYVKCFKM